MSQLDRIANLLREQIRSRQTLAIGSAQSASIQGTRALYQTPSGIISAIATNFCYGDCLLAKVEGTWYAINPSDNREVVRGSVNRLIQHKPKLAIAVEPYPGKFIGVSDFGDPRRLGYDFDVNLTQLGASLTPPINPAFMDIYIDNIIGTDGSDLKDGYWRIARFAPQVLPSFISLDSAGVSIQYNVNLSQSPNNSLFEYVGNSKFFAVQSFNFGVTPQIPLPYTNLLLMRFYSPSGVETGTTILTSYSLQQPQPQQLGLYTSPVPGAIIRPRSILGSYYRDAGGSVQISNSPNGQILNGESYNGLLVTGIILVNYPTLSIESNSKLPLLIGQKTLSRVISTPLLKSTDLSERKYTGWDAGSQTGTLISTKSYFNITTSTIISYDLDGLTIDLNQYQRYFFLNPTLYNLVGNDTIQFLQNLHQFPLEVISESFFESVVGVGVINQSQSYTANPLYLNYKNAKVAIVTDQIQNCRFTDLQMQLQPASVSEYYAIGATYAELNNHINPTSYRGLLFIEAGLFEPESTIIVNSADCYAKFYKVTEQNNKLYALEFWVTSDGQVNLIKIHERENAPNETIELFRDQRVYYPGFEGD